MSAMVDSFDMPMGEYPADFDISMHGSADQWLFDEAKMEEDSPSTQRIGSPLQSKTESLMAMKTDSSQKYGGDVEVEMASYADVEHIEFDMLDGDAALADETEILDVEVYDASQTHSPTFIAADTHELHIESTPTLPLLPLPHVTPIPEHPVPPMNHPDVAVAEEVHQEHIIEAAAPSSEHVEHDDGTSTVHDYAHEHALHEEVQLEEHVVDAVYVTGEQAPVEHAEGWVDEETTQDAVSGFAPEAAEEVHVEEVQALVDETQHLSEGSLQPEEERAPSSDLPQVTPSVSQELVEATYQHDSSAHADSAAYVGDEAHDLSEGAFMDLPPAILLSLSSDQTFDYSLFTRPSEDFPDATHYSNPHLLLEDSASLFYEPLTTFFEAFRQDEAVNSIPNSAESELVISAVDLHISLSEDNVHSREITLHDLNLLHESLGFEGYLRLKVFTGEPRFLVRYQALQEQIMHLHVAGSQAAPVVEHSDSRQDFVHPEEVPPAEQHHEEQEETAHFEHHQETVEEFTEQALDEQFSHEETQIEEDLEQHQHVDDDGEGEGEAKATYESEGVLVEHDDTVEEDQQAQEDPQVQEEHIQHGHDVEETGQQSRETSETLSDSRSAHASPAPAPQTVIPLEDAESSQTSAEQSPAEGHAEEAQDYDGDSTRGDFEAEETLHHDEDEEDSSSYDTTAEFEGGDEEYEGESDHHDADLGADHKHAEDAQHADTELETNEPETVHAREAAELSTEEWDDDADAEGDVDATWDPEDPEDDVPSLSSVEPHTSLSTKSSKRTYDQVDLLDDDDHESWQIFDSPGSKRSRIE